MYKDASLTQEWKFGTDTITGDTTLYAKWNKDVVVNEYTVTFDSNGGTDVLPLTGVAEGSLITKPTDPSKVDNTFAGWYKDSGLTQVWNF